MCDFCKDLELHSPQAYVDDIAAALDLFQTELPRTFVNLVSVLNVPIVEELNIGLVCSTLHRQGFVLKYFSLIKIYSTVSLIT